MDKNIKNRDDVKKIAIEELMKDFSSGEKIDVEKIIRKVKEMLQLKGNVKEIIKKSTSVRGEVLEMSIHIESLLNEILLNYYFPIDLEVFRKDILFRTLSFSQKKDIINSIIKREKLKNKNIVSSDFGSNFDDLIRIRNIYAHYPEDVFNDSFYIETSHKQFESMEELHKKFVELSKSFFQQLSNIAKYMAENRITNSGLIKK